MSASTLSGNAGTTALGAVGAGTPCEECAEQSDAVPHPDACCRFVTTTESTDSPTDLRTHNGQSSRLLTKESGGLARRNERSAIESRPHPPKDTSWGKTQKDRRLDTRPQTPSRARTLWLQKGSIEEIHTEFVAMGIYTSKSTVSSVEPVGDETCPQNTTMPRKTQRQILILASRSNTTSIASRVTLPLAAPRKTVRRTKNQNSASVSPLKVNLPARDVDVSESGGDPVIVAPRNVARLMVVQGVSPPTRNSPTHLPPIESVLQVPVR